MGSPPAPRIVVGRFDGDTAEIGRARHLVRTTLLAWGLPAHADAFELGASELVTNALVHGDGEIELRLIAAADEVRLEVADRGGCLAPPRPVRPPPEARGGWGLQLVEEMSNGWGASTGPAHTRVWMARRTDDARS
jgi:anti-sigma regulatory factor (Ser/Thr protein kinase)